MGMKEQLEDIKFAADSALKSVITLQTEIVTSEQQIDRVVSKSAQLLDNLNSKMEKLNMDATKFLAAVKLIDDATTALATDVDLISARITAMAKIISDNSTGNAAVDAAVTQLSADADALTKTATTLKAIATDTIVPDEQRV